MPPRRAGMVDKRTHSCPTRSKGRSSNRAKVSARFASLISLSRDGAFSASAWPSPGNEGAMTSSCKRSLTKARAPGWPHHQVATCGSFSSSPKKWLQMRGRKPSSARDSSTPEPGILTTATPPLRIASIMPGVPRRELLFSSRGSIKSASTRRKMTSARFSPSMVRT